YGYPRKSEAISAVRTMDIVLDQGKCTADYGLLTYVLPLKNKDNPPSDSSVNDDWARYNGFNVIRHGTQASKDNFPTTGYYGAQFELVNSGTIKSSEFNWTTDRDDIVAFDTATSSNNTVVKFLGTDTVDPVAMHNKLPATV